MSSETPKQPELHPPPDPLKESNEPGYKPAATDIESQEHLNLVENFIGSIYGEAKQIDKSNVGSSQYTKGLKFDAKASIVDARRSLLEKGQVNAPLHHSTPVQGTNQQQPSIPPPIPVPSQQAAPGFIQQTQPTTPSTSDSLILKHEIDQLKEQIVDIKKLYDEFFKLKQVKGHWQVKANNKIQKTTSIAKTWNAINKLLKNKTDSIIIEYKESDD